VQYNPEFVQYKREAGERANGEQIRNWKLIGDKYGVNEFLRNILDLPYLLFSGVAGGNFAHHYPEKEISKQGYLKRTFLYHIRLYRCDYHGGL
jgi:hypothetical protein